MPIGFEYNETVAVNRLEDVPGGNKKVFAEHIPALRCHIQPLDPEFSQDLDTGFGKDLIMFCEVADIADGDRVLREVGEATKEYRVKGVQSLNFHGSSHMEVILRIFESQ